MSRSYNVIDADGHVLEPFTLWNDYMDPQYRDHQGSRWISDIAFGEYLDSHDIGRTPEATYESYVLISNDLSMEWLAGGLSTTVHSIYAGP